MFYFNCPAVNVALAKAQSNRADIATAPYRLLVEDNYLYATDIK
jgi:hypothetical protein